MTKSVLPTVTSNSIVCVVGARPNFMKMAPILKAFGGRENVPPILLVHTGQHYDDFMSGQLFAALSLPDPDINLAVGSGSHAVQTAEVMLRFDALLRDCKPRCVIVVGDVNSTLACALVAAKKNVPVMHIEAGLRSGDKKMPEEINRILTDQISERLYTTESSAEDNLVREGISRERVRFVGNVMIDSVIASRPQMIDPAVTFGKFGYSDFLSKSQRFAVATFHRPSNVDERPSLQNLVQLLADVSEKLPLALVLHPRTSERLSRYLLMDRLLSAKIALLPPQGYLEMLGLLAKATVVLTDSGGLQEETTALGVPCLTIRENTERPITVVEGTNTLVGPSSELVVKLVEQILNGQGKQGRVPLLWDGQAAERIVDDILVFLAEE